MLVNIFMTSINFVLDHTEVIVHIHVGLFVQTFYVGIFVLVTVYSTATLKLHKNWGGGGVLNFWKEKYGVHVYSF